MPLLIPALLLAGVGGAWWFSSSAGSAAGTAAGQGISDAAVIIGLAVAASVVIYTVKQTK